MSTFCLRGGTIHDPANGIDGAVLDLVIADGKINAVGPAGELFADRVIDVSGDVVMPGGVEMHCHIAGPKVNLARRMFPEFDRADPFSPINSTRATGRLFAGLGYTTAFDAAIPPLLARHAHFELNATPVVDKGCYLLFDNNQFVLDSIREGREQELDAYLGWGMQAGRGYAIKIVNPGGVENWKQISRKSLRALDEVVPNFGVSPRQIVQGLSAAADRLSLPHAVHIHCNNLGMPGNWETTRHTMESLDGRRGHFAHIQFHSYGGNEADPTSFCSAVEPLIEFVHQHPNITVDVGHIHPGRTLSMTGDAPFSQHLHELTGGRWYAADAEAESSCGVIPMEYRPEKSLIHAVQWAIALEWYLLMQDPWRIAMTSDHPNGGAVTRYPEMIHLLMDHGFRRAALERMPKNLTERCRLHEIDREYTLQEIAIITRAAPARILGLNTKGHLGVGADADITVYPSNPNRTEMFARPRHVFKGGAAVVGGSELREEPLGTTIRSTPGYDAEVIPRFRDWFEQNYSIQFANYAIGPDELLPGSRTA